MADKKPEEKKALGEVLKKLLPLIFAGLNLMVVGGGAALVYFSTIGYDRAPITESKEEKELEKSREAAESHPVIYTMEPLIVNLDGSPRRVIRTEINLELLDEQGFEEVVNMGPETRDAIVRLFNSKSFAQLETIQGKLFLKDQIATTVNQFLKQGLVKDVYFSEFIVQ